MGKPYYNAIYQELDDKKVAVIVYFNSGREIVCQGEYNGMWVATNVASNAITRHRKKRHEKI